MSRGVDRHASIPEGLAVRLAEADLSERVRALLRALEGHAGGVWIVGGTVRDVLLGVPEIADLDVVAERGSLELARRIADSERWAYVVLDERRGTARVVAPDGSHLDVNAIVGESIEDDLRQRDLTINALAIPVDRGAVRLELVDPCEGADDLDDELIRLTSERAVLEDPLRLVRVFRFSTTLGFIIVPETLAAVAAHAPLLAGVAPERVVTELALVLDDAGSSAVLRRMDEVGLLEQALPEVGPMRGVEQNDYHHLDVLAHSLLALDRFERLLADLPSVFGEHADNVAAFLHAELAAGRPRLIAVKLATLFHDLGKPTTRSTELGRTTFYHHNVEGAQRATEACRRLRLSNAEAEEIAYYVHAHMVPGDAEKAAFQAESGIGPGSAFGTSQRSILRYAGRRGERGLVLALMAVADSMSMAGPLADPDRPERLRRFSRRVASAYYDEVAPRAAEAPLLTGDDLIERFGLESGPGVGVVLTRLRELQLEGALATRDQALAEAARLVAEQPGV